MLSIWVFPNLLVFLNPLTDLYHFSGLLCLVRCSNWLHVYHSQLHRQMGELVAESWAGSLLFSFKLSLVYLLQIVNLNFQLSLLWIGLLAFLENSFWRYCKEFFCFSFPESLRMFRNSSSLIFSGSSFIQDLNPNRCNHDAQRQCLYINIARSTNMFTKMGVEEWKQIFLFFFFF